MGRKKSRSLETTIGKILPSSLCVKLENLATRQLPLTTQYPSPGDKALDDMHTEKWAIICLWIAYKRYPYIDISRSPYNRTIFQEWKRLAFAWNTQLNLVQNTFDAAKKYPGIFKKLEKYEAPLNLWFACMGEYRKPSGQKGLKGQSIIQIKKHLSEIKQRKIIEPSEPPAPINDELFNISIQLSSQHKEIDISLNEYYQWVNEYITKDASKFNMPWVEEEKLMARNKKHPQPFSVLPPKTLEALKNNSTHLSTITHRVWSEQPVYISATSAIF